MSGHSKWSKVKHQKEQTDAKKSRVYTIFAKRIAMAAKEGKGLSQAVEQAKLASIPKEVIERAVNYGKYSLENLHAVAFDGFFLNGKVGLIITGETDNNTRISNQIKNILEKHGGRLGEPGSAHYFFNKVNLIYIKHSDENLSLVLDSGADDFSEENGYLMVEVGDLNLKNVQDFFKNRGVEILSEEIFYKPQAEIKLSHEEKSRVNDLISGLTEIKEVTAIHANA